MKADHDPFYWKLVSRTIAVLGLILAGLLFYAGAHPPVLW
jgi:hypothetical protein